MTLNLATGTAGRFRAAVFLLVVTMFSVAPLVRATDHLRGEGGQPPLLRLNRGFNLPQTKARLLPPPAVEHIQTIGTYEGSLPPVPDTVLCLDEAVPDSAPQASPDTLRGPPPVLTL
jgi:hypothetical protein